MGNFVPLLLAFFFLFHLATAESSYMDSTLPAGSGEPFYPDPEGILSSLCDICGISFLFCNHRFAPFRANPPTQRFINANDLLLHPEWPRDPEHPRIEQVPAQQPDHNRRQPLQHAHVQRLHDGPTTIQPTTLQVWTELSYNPGDRTSPQRRSAPKKAGFPCLHPDCQKVYDRQCDLRRHTKVHLDKSKRPYKCSFCTEAFNYPKDRERHQRTHRELPVPQDKMYCPVTGCSNTEGFSRKDNYLRHMRNQHPDAALVAQYQV